MSTNRILQSLNEELDDLEELSSSELSDSVGGTSSHSQVAEASPHVVGEPGRLNPLFDSFGSGAGPAPAHIEPDNPLASQVYGIVSQDFDKVSEYMDQPLSENQLIESVNHATQSYGTESLSSAQVGNIVQTIENADGISAGRIAETLDTEINQDYSIAEPFISNSVSKSDLLEQVKQGVAEQVQMGGDTFLNLAQSNPTQELALKVEIEYGSGIYQADSVITGAESSVESQYTSQILPNHGQFQDGYQAVQAMSTQQLDQFVMNQAINDEKSGKFETSTEYETNLSSQVDKQLTRITDAEMTTTSDYYSGELPMSEAPSYSSNQLSNLVVNEALHEGEKGNFIGSNSSETNLVEKVENASGITTYLVASQIYENGSPGGAESEMWNNQNFRNAIPDLDAMVQADANKMGGWVTGGKLAGLEEIVSSQVIQQIADEGSDNSADS